MLPITSMLLEFVGTLAICQRLPTHSVNPSLRNIFFISSISASPSFCFLAPHWEPLSFSTSCSPQSGYLETTYLSQWLLPPFNKLTRFLWSAWPYFCYEPCNSCASSSIPGNTICTHRVLWQMVSILLFKKIGNVLCCWHPSVWDS